MKKSAENFIQQQCVMAFNNEYCLEKHSPRCLISSIPNESEDGREGQKKVNTGLLAGASDTFVLFPNAKVVFIEFKTPIGVQSTKQKKFQSRVEALGFDYHLVRSQIEFNMTLKPYLLEAGLNG